MAKKNNDVSSSETNSFVKGLNKDSDSSFIQEGMWTHARNVVNNTVEGNLGTLSAESSNYLCATVGATLNGSRKVIIGAVHLYSDKWIIYTASYNGPAAISLDSEIGLFEEDVCKYRPIVQDTCLNFHEFNLIYGASREKEDCSWAVYWNDGLNPDRYLNIGDPKTWPGDEFIWIGNNTYSDGANTMQWPGVSWVQNCTDSNGDTAGGCITCVDTKELDCDKIRLARLMTTPCVHLEPGKVGGELENGSYFVVVAYSIKGQKVTDWFSPSNVQPLWTQNNLQSSLEINISADKNNFDEFILVIVKTINQGTVAKQIGIYSTNTEKIFIDQISESLVSVPIEQLPIQTPVYEKCDQIVEVNNYLLRVGPTSKFEFNYQPLANLIKAQWVSVEYPADYYVKGGYKPSYLRDEVYSFFIRWVYDTGDKSVSYHIPGRPPVKYNNIWEYQEVVTDPAYNKNVLFTDTGEEEKLFEVENTATYTAVSPPEVLEDGGRIIARGKMGYWESSEFYPDKNPEVWNSSSHCWTGLKITNTQYDLCGKPIRHHKFPDNITLGSDLTNHYSQNGSFIRILGVEFENIILPKDNDGNDIPGIVGYEILRGSREGNRTVLAKGMINNMRPYNTKGQTGPTTRRKGLYPNHPFNTIVAPETNIDDPYITVTDDNGNIVNLSSNDIPKNIISFHSPDTNFKNPYLSAVELKLYGNMRGISEQNFIYPNLHPKHKLLGNFSAFIALMAGVIDGIISIAGETSFTQPGGAFNTPYVWPMVNGTTAVPFTVGAQNGNLTNTQTFYFGTQGWNGSLGTYFSTGAGLPDGIFGNPLLSQYYRVYRASGNYKQAPTLTIQNSKGRIMGAVLSAFQFIQYFNEGAELALKVIYACLPYRQYALQMLGHGFYNKFVKNTPPANNPYTRFKIEDSLYLKDNIQDLNGYIDSTSGTNQLYSINNLKRQQTVVLRTKSGPITNKDTGPYFITSPTIEDNSLITLGTAKGKDLTGSGISVPNDIFDEDKVSSVINAKIASHYGAMKIRLRNQYGQLDSIKQIPITPCEQKLSEITLNEKYIASCLVSNCEGSYRSNIKQKVILRTKPYFNGDTYINRYTEKNNMFFFYDWLYGQPDGYEYNYGLRQMIPLARFAANTEAYDTNDFYNGIASTIASNPADLVNLNTLYLNGYLPSRKYVLDAANFDYVTNQQQGLALKIGVKERYFYLATSVIRDFFVESEVIVDDREAGPEPYQKFYNPNAFTDLPTLFNINPDWITKGNYYAYDYSLSISKLYTQYFSQGNLQSRYYDPKVASLCYTYYPDRILYSLPQTFESAKDSWFVYLANNYKEFKDQISGVKNFARTGIFISFKNSGPVVFQGVDQLETEAGVKVTLGDGGLFTQTPQSVTISDAQYEYGSCQNKHSLISTPAGFFYISQNQGKIFKFDTSISEVSQLGLKWWFVLYLPYKIQEDFPQYPHLDNPVAGVGCQSIYNNRDGIVYFSKKDYKLKDAYKDRVTYNECKNIFQIDGNGKYRLGDPLIFDNASWTVSFDPKSEFFISFHDWYPDLMLPSKITFMTTKDNGIWVHNNTCTSFCNYYGIPKPLEIELPINTGQNVTTLRSVEYMLECYKRYDCVDQFHILDQNFDHAFIYNSEQVSGHLHLNLFPKNNITLAQQYPIINPNSIDILFSKEENKYRINQFWDVTKDRGEFPIGSNYPPTGPLVPGTTILAGPKANERIWITEPNGFIRDLNPLNLDYNKPFLERKKFRHYLNYLVLRKDIVGDVDMILKLTNAKQVYSPR